MNCQRKKFLQAAGLAAILLLISSCGRKAPEKIEESLKKAETRSSLITFVVGDVKIKRGEEIFKAITRGELKDGDIVLTGASSCVTVQLFDKIFRIESNSNVEITSIEQYGQNEFFLKEGMILSKLSKLKRNEKYIIKTPTAVAAVRGTVFLTEYKAGVSNVAVSRGRVSVHDSSSGYEKMTEEGTSSVVFKNITNRAIDPVEKLTLQKIDTTPVIENLSEIPDGELEQKTGEFIENDNKINSEIDKLLKSKMSLEEVKQRFGRIDEVTLYSGKVYRGAILSRGNKIKMVTPTGIVNINNKDIKQTQSK